MEAIIEKISSNIMGTTDITMKIKGMRKFQNFIVYPLDKDNSSNIITIQSGTRIGKIDVETGRGVMSKSHSSGAYFHHLQMDVLTKFELSDLDNTALKLKIFTSADKNAGNSVVSTDNSGAINILGL